jgi:hypothetical protein
MGPERMPGMREHFNGFGSVVAEVMLAFALLKRKEEEITRLPWRGQCGRAAAARALSACCAAGYAMDCTGSPVCF